MVAGGAGFFAPRILVYFRLIVTFASPASPPYYLFPLVFFSLPHSFLYFIYFYSISFPSYLTVCFISQMLWYIYISLCSHPTTLWSLYVLLLPFLSFSNHGIEFVAIWTSSISPQYILYTAGHFDYRFIKHLLLLELVSHPSICSLAPFLDLLDNNCFLKCPISLNILWIRPAEKLQSAKVNRTQTNQS